MVDTQPAAVYVRQSKASKRSIAEQEADGRRACEQNGWPVLGVYEDTTSASEYARKERPDWRRLLADLASGKFTILVMWESSRGDRKLSSWAAMLERCKEHGVRIHVVADERTYDPRKARDWKTLADDGVRSADESNKLSERALRTVREGAQQGRPHGPCPYGYERRYDPVTRELTEQRPDLATAPVVREIVSRLAAGEPISAVTDDLNRRGVPAPKGGTWYRSHVRKVALNPLYIGKRVHRGQPYDAMWPPIVPESDFYAVTRRLGDPARKTARPGRHKYLLSWIAVCGECGAYLKGATGRNTGRHPLYACSRGCTYAPMAEMDEHVGRYVRLELYRNEELRRWIGQQGSDDAEAVRARAEADSLQAQLDELARDLTISARTLAIRDAEILSRIEAAGRRAAGAAGSIPGPDDILAMWEATASLHWKRDMLARIFSRVALYKAPRRGKQPWTGERVGFEFRARPGVEHKFAPVTRERIDFHEFHRLLSQHGYRTPFVDMPGE